MIKRVDGAKCTMTPSLTSLLCPPALCSVPRASTGAPRPNYTGSVLGGSRGGGGLFGEMEDDRVPTTRLGKVGHAGAVVWRYVVGGGLILAMSGAAMMLGVYYFANPEAEVRARTTKILQGDPTALKLIGPHLMDVTLRTKGSRAMQAFHRWPYFGTHPVEMEYVLQGKNGRAFVMVQYMKSGSDWKPVYLHLDTNHGRAVLLDVRARN
jgi:hypothetical protein